MDPDTPLPPPQPSIFRWVLGFLMVGAAWGLTTPFMRRAAINYTAPERPWLNDPSKSWIRRKASGVIYAVLDLLRRPAYAFPLLVNITGSVWFFLLIGQAGKSLFVCLFFDAHEAEQHKRKSETYVKEYGLRSSSKASRRGNLC